MVKVADIFAFINGLAPFDTAMDFDNVGLLVGDMDAEVRKCVVALDVTAAVVDEAASFGASLIISHHPVIFTPLKALQASSIPYELARRGIAAICAHTNLDMAAFGVNTCLAEALSLRNLVPLSTYETRRGALPMGLVGELEIEKAYEEFARFVKERLSWTLSKRGFPYLGRAIWTATNRVLFCDSVLSDYYQFLKQVGHSIRSYARVNIIH